MRENHRKIFIVLLALILMVSLWGCSAAAPEEPSSPESGSLSSQPEPEPEPEPGSVQLDRPVQEIIDRVMDYYYVGSGEVDGPFKGSIPTPGPTIGASIYWYTTGTEDRGSMEALLEHLQTGAHLVPRLKLLDRVYSIVYDDNGYICGHIEESTETEEIVAADSFSAEEAERYRRDFRWPELLETAITEGKFEYPNDIRMRACDFVGFATGAVVYDGGSEYFIPTNGEALHSVPFEVGTLYPVDELADLLYDHLDELFGGPPMNTGGNGGDPEPEGRPEIGTGPFSPWDQMMHWSEEEIDRLVTEIAGRLYLEDETLTGLTPVLQGSGYVQYDHGILVSDPFIGYVGYQNDKKEYVAFRTITCSVTWVESERKYILDPISVEEWEQE